MPQPNMKKQYRAELRELKKRSGEIRRCSKRAITARDHRLREIYRNFIRENRAYGREFDRIEKRRRILEGRLS